MLIDAAIGITPQLQHLQQARTLQVFGSTSAIDWEETLGFRRYQAGACPLLPVDQSEVQRQVSE
jgi:hypothetical protein